MKTCSKCKALKELLEFRKCSASKDGRQNYCAACAYAASKKRYSEKIILINEVRRAYSASMSPEGKEKIRVRNLLWRKLNPGYVSPCRSTNPRYDADWRKERYDTDPEFKLMVTLRTRQRSEILRAKSVKSASTLELTGCSAQEIWTHLNSQFRPGMTEENYGPVWHVDHIKPCASFDLTDPEQQRACFHWTNLQPLFVLENLKKGDTYHG